MQSGVITTYKYILVNNMARSCPDLCVLRSEGRAHIGGKRFSRNLWKQSIGRVSCSSSCEDKNRQYPTHKSLPDHNVTTSNFLQNIFPKTFLTDFADFLNFFSSNIRHRRFILTFYKKCFFPSLPHLLNSDIHLARVCKTTVSFPPSFYKIYSHYHFSDIPSNVQYIRISRPQCCHILPCT